MIFIWPSSAVTSRPSLLTPGRYTVAPKASGVSRISKSGLTVCSTSVDRSPSLEVFVRFRAALKVFSKDMVRVVSGFEFGWIEVRLLDGNGYLLRLDLFRLRQRDRQNSILVGRVDFIRLDFARHADRTTEGEGLAGLVVRVG